MSGYRRLFTNANENQEVPSYLIRFHDALACLIHQGIADYCTIQLQAASKRNEDDLARLFARISLYTNCYQLIYPALPGKPGVTDYVHDALNQLGYMDSIEEYVAQMTPQTYMREVLMKNVGCPFQFWSQYIAETPALLCENAANPYDPMHHEFINHTQAVLDGLEEAETYLRELLRGYFQPDLSIEASAPAP